MKKKRNLRGEGGCTRKIFSPDQGQGPGLASALALAWPLPSLFFLVTGHARPGWLVKKEKKRPGPGLALALPVLFFSNRPPQAWPVGEKKKRKGLAPALALAWPWPSQCFLVTGQARPRELVKKEKKRPGPNLAWPWPGLAPPKLMLTNEKEKLL